MASAPASVRVYYQVVDDARERAQGRFFKFETFDESDAGRAAARSARFLTTPRVLPRGEFERSREGIIRDVRRSLGLDAKEKELRADAWTKTAVTLIQVRKLQEAAKLLKDAIALAPNHAAAKQAMTQVERMLKDATPSADEYELLVRVRSVSYETKTGGRSVRRSGEALADYVFLPKGRTRSGFSSSGRSYRKADIVRDQRKVVETLLRDRNLVVARVQRGSTKAVSWTQTPLSGWQLEDCCPYRELRESRTLMVKEKIPFET